jgi:hypothetical protein
VILCATIPKLPLDTCLGFCDLLRLKPIHREGQKTPPDATASM